MLVPRVIIGERQTNHWRPFGKKERPDVVVIAYNTAEIVHLNARGNYDRYGLRPYYVPAKYAILLQHGWDDTEMIGQAYASSDEFLHRAIWFNHFDDIAFALGELKKKFPNEVVADQIDYITDWPLQPRTPEYATGKSLVMPVTPVLTKIEYPEDEDD